jgi:tetratricopeptide (TPR) repeat protein
VKRPKEHIIEEESVKAFKNLIPDSWVINEFTKDYGKDLHIEIFKNYEATGKIFIVQVKGSNQVIDNDSMSVSMKIDTLKYYQDLEYPVLLVFYSTRKKSFWATWANGLLSAVKIKPTQRSLLVTLTEYNRIDSEFFSRLPDDFHSMIPYVVNVVVHAPSEKANMVEWRIYNWLQTYFPLSYKIRQWQYPRILDISIVEEHEKLYLTFEQSGDLLQLRPISLAENGIWFYKPRVDEKEIHPQELPIVYEIANRFAKSFLPNAMRLFKFVVPHLSKPLPLVGLLAMAMDAINANCIHELDELIDACLEAESVDQFIYCNYAYFTRKEFHLKYSNNLVRGLDKFRDRSAAAELAYNLGNYYRYNGQSYEASTYYHLCRKRNKDYVNRDYWWQEYAGILHGTGHYKLAAKFYEKSLELEDAGGLAIFTRLLVADSYFHLGQFNKAVAKLDEHIEMVSAMKKIPCAHATLLRMACIYLIEQKMDELARDRVLSDQLVQQGIDQKDVSFFENAVRSNPVNDLAWFNIGSFYAQNDNYEKAYRPFEVSALLQETDVITWFLCFTCAVNNHDSMGCLFIIQLCMEKFGSNVINDFIQFIHDKSDLPEEKMLGLVQYFESVMNTIEKTFLPKIFQPPKEIVRIFRG